MATRIAVNDRNQLKSLPKILASILDVQLDLLELLETLSDEDLIAFADTQDDPNDSTDIKIYILVHFFVFAKIGSSSHLENALIRTEAWAALTSNTRESTNAYSLMRLLTNLKGREFWRSRWMELLNGARDSMELHGNTDIVEYLDNSFSLLKEARVLVPQDHEDAAHADALDGLCHEYKYRLTGNIADLDYAIEYLWKAAHYFSTGHPNRIAYLHFFLEKENFRGRLVRAENRAGLEKMMEVLNTLYQFLPPDRPARSNRLHELSICFKEYSDAIESIDSLHKAIDLATASVETASENDSKRPRYTHNLVCLLYDRYERLGSLIDLNKAIEIGEQSLIDISSRPKFQYARDYMMNTLSSCLASRYYEAKVLQDLDRAIELMEAYTPAEVAGKAAYLNNLGAMLQLRFDRNMDIKDVDKSIDLVKTAIELQEAPHLYRALSQGLYARATYYKDILGLSEAIEAGKKVIKTTSSSDIRLPIHIRELGIFYSRRYDLSDDMTDLDESIKLLTLSAETTPPGYMSYAHTLGDLAGVLRQRAKRNGSQEDLDRANSLLRQSISYQSYISPEKVILSIIHATRSEDDATAEERYNFLEKAVQVITQASPMSMQQSDQQYMMSQFAGVPSDAAAAALNAGKSAFHALSLLEHGRGVITDHLMKIRTNISELEENHPDLANQFVTLRNQLDSVDEKLVAAGRPSGAGALSFGDFAKAGSLQKQRIEAEKEFHNLCEKIRKLSGFENFLLPLTAEEMMGAADPDPIVVINVSHIRCDAFIVEKHQIRSIELPKFKSVHARFLGTLIREADNFKERPHSTELSLEWMWVCVARPVLDALGFTETPTDGDWPRVWWIPTGFLTRLPLHAAGYHFSFPRTNNTVMDRVMSSYSSSIKALIYGRRRGNVGATHQQSDKALIVSMPDTDGQASLPNVEKEVGVLNDLCQSLKLVSVVPRSTRDDILKAMRDCKVFHFAGHGLADASDPSKSGLLLKEGVRNLLSVTDLQRNQLQSNPPFLAYLSACSTGAAEAEELLDEGINLVSACQLAGFRHVIGTLWEVSDPHCVDVTKTLYETIRDEGMTDRAICKGLHKGVKKLRDRAAWRTVRSRMFPDDEFDSDDDDTAWEAFAGAGEDDSPATSRSGTDELETLFNGLSVEDGKLTERGVADMARNFKKIIRYSDHDDAPLDLYWVPYLHFGV
ncbi:hypothetical protein TWF694_011536 [Orbilia ellipsospora]|uniref:CHAT domain-containing protein n=1 Tax=Orbilia ellipsospora TaxID=2528407 RepID=A0AAV9X849_9PEZI